MSLNDESIALIKEFEGLRLEAYHCPAGVLTIGYGHTSRAGPPTVREGMSVTEERAESILRADLAEFERAVDAAIKKPMSDNQRGAFVSLAMNIGASAFAKSTAVKRFNAGDVHGAAEAITWWNKAGGKVLRGLVRRREAERALFLSDDAEEVEEAPVSPSVAVEGGAHKAPAKSKTLIGAGTAGAVIVLDQIGQVREAAEQAGLAEYIPYVALAVIGYIALNRYLEWRAGEH